LAVGAMLAIQNHGLNKIPEEVGIVAIQVIASFAPLLEPALTSVSHLNLKWEKPLPNAARYDREKNLIQTVSRVQ